MDVLGKKNNTFGVYFTILVRDNVRFSTLYIVISAGRVTLLFSRRPRLNLGWTFRHRSQLSIYVPRRTSCVFKVKLSSCAAFCGDEIFHPIDIHSEMVIHGYSFILVIISDRLIRLSKVQFH